MHISSSAFSDGEKIPEIYTCDGSDINPPLTFSDVPEKTKSLMLIIDDPDAPAGSANPGWVHWILYNIDAKTKQLAEDERPEEARAGINDWGRASYGGPCPHMGTHHYVHTLYALDTELDFPMPPTKSELLQAIENHTLATAALTGLYKKR